MGRLDRTPHTSLLAALVLLLGPAAGPALAQDAPLSLAPEDPSLEWGPCGDFIPAECQATILRLGPEGRNSDVLYRIPANMELPAHWHTSAERMILISGEFHVDYDGYDPLVMRSGSYAWGPPQVPHTARCGDQGTCLLFVAFEEPPDGFPVEDG